MAEKKVAILIPYWVKEVLRRNSLPLSACLDFSKIKPLLSLDDLAAFLALQDSKYFKIITGTELFQEQLTLLWSNSIVNTDVELYEFLWKILNPISLDESYSKVLMSRLFNKDALDIRFNESYAIYDLTSEAFGVVLYPGYFISNNMELQKSVIESIIELLYRYQSFHEVARTPFFKGYLELLSVNKS